jgi:hypothetical protein
MAGNIFEWTADWKGPYASTPVSDPIGAPNPDGYYQKTLKGGSFKHGSLFLRPSRRAGTYQMPLSASADFIGFRCAAGAIPHPRYFSADSALTGANPCAVISGALPAFLGSPRSKLAFVNVSGSMRTLCLVDFGSPAPVIREFPDVSDVHDPAVSPDGRFVAFGSRGEGIDGPAAVSIRCTDSTDTGPWTLDAQRAYIPRWWIDPDSRDTLLVYATSAVDNQSAVWPSTRTMAQKMRGGKPSGDPRTIVEDGSFHGGLSALGQYIVTGYSRCILRDLISQTQLPIFISPYNGKDASGSAQVCNVSIAPDPEHPDRCMFLDFGSGNRMSTLVHEAYGIHEYLFIAEKAGTAITWCKRPAGESAWDSPQWSNRAGFAAACCRNARMDAHAVYCINLDTKAVLQVVEGVELSDPYLWIGQPHDTSSLCGFSDSLGNYGVPPLSGDQVLFSYKMHLFWKLHRNLEIAFVGSSQVYSGIDCAKLPGYTALNLGNSGAGVLASANLIRNYILPSCPKIKLIGISAGIYWLGNPGGEAGDSWTTALSQSKGYQYDLHHNFWREGFPAGFDECVAQAPYLTYFNCDTAGLCLDQCDSWGGAAPDMAAGGDWNWGLTDPEYVDNFNEITRLIEDCAEAKVHVLMVNFPESPAYKNTDHYSRFGPSWATGKTVAAQLKSLEGSHPNFHFYDAYNDGNHDYSDAEAINWNHLCPKGADKLTGRIDSLVHSTFGK